MRVVAKTVLFTGHMIDRADRKSARFPENITDRVKEIIKGKLIGEKKKCNNNEVLKGLAGGACGGDILFHEACLESGISSEMLLSDTVAKFKEESVEYAGPAWIKRFDRLYMKIPHVVLHHRSPIYQSGNCENHVDKWSATNLEMLALADRQSNGNVVLIALWDGASGDGPGGTAHLVALAKNKDFDVIIIPVNDISNEVK